MNATYCASHAMGGVFASMILPPLFTDKRPIESIGYSAGCRPRLRLSVHQSTFLLISSLCSRE
ncbi:hypothetical protein BN1221_02570 [Brenneria goodwinii]|uniref:Uncharacterized protein n=1 Tax=Brenneria goodwinii TaxID=1109412 RepID=A0A0G4JW13_9GAMM|nr:hypothetical protein BN1221_02570 [Brenneria goodwinii]